MRDDPILYHDRSRRFRKFRSDRRKNVGPSPSHGWHRQGRPDRVLAPIAVLVAAAAVRGSGVS
jgi:hypothetical protein